MRDIKIHDNKDIDFEGGNLVWVEGFSEVSQKIRLHLRIALGEWFLDPTLGFDYFGVVFKKQWEEGEIKGAVYEALEDIDEIDEIEKIELDFDNIERKMTINLAIKLENGERFNGEVVIA